MSAPTPTAFDGWNAAIEAAAAHHERAAKKLLDWARARSEPACWREMQQPHEQHMAAAAAIRALQPPAEIAAREAAQEMPTAAMLREAATYFEVRRVDALTVRQNRRNSADLRRQAAERAAFCEAASRAFSQCAAHAEAALAQHGGAS